MSQQTRSGGVGVTGATSGGPLAAVAGFALLIDIVGLFVFTGVALCVFGYIVLTLFMASGAERGAIARRVAPGSMVLFFSWAAALVGGALVGLFHWVEYRHVAYVVLGLYALAVLIWVIARAFTAIWVLLFSLVGVALFLAVAYLHPPPGSLDMEKKENWTPVDVTVVDRDGRPVNGASVYLDLCQFWQGDPALDGDREWWSKATTGADGIAHITVMQDPRYKRLLLRVRCEPIAPSYIEPATAGEAVGYDDARLESSLPVERVPYAFKFVMTERAHPDSAFLEIEFDVIPSPDANAVWDREIYLVLTTERELPWDERHRNFNEAALAKAGGLHKIGLRISPRCALKLGSESAGRPLTLHVLERDYHENDEAYVELKRVSVEPIALGGRRAIKLPIPKRNAPVR